MIVGAMLDHARERLVTVPDSARLGKMTWKGPEIMITGRCLTLWSAGFGLLISVISWTDPLAAEACAMRLRDLPMDCRVRSGVEAAASVADLRMPVAAPGRIMSRSNDQAFVQVVGESAIEPREKESAGGGGGAEAADQAISAHEAAAAIAAALAGAQSGMAPDVAEGREPMTRAERDAFRLATQGCWKVDPGSPARRAIVTVGFDLDRDSRVVGEVQLLMHDAPTREAAEQAFEAARRAILRCQDEVVPLPPEEHDQERRAEMTFDARTWTIR